MARRQAGVLWTAQAILRWRDAKSNAGGAPLQWRVMGCCNVKKTRHWSGAPPAMRPSLPRMPTFRLMIACAALLATTPAHAQDKPPIRGLVSMGAYRFVGYGGDPVNTLAPLDAKPGIFGG